MSEWPGQSEGEGMDLDHFWNVVSMYHPEDHPVEWLHFMKSGIFGEKDSDVDLCMPCLGKTDSYQNFPDEERMFEGISEKQRESIYNYEHRSKLRNRVEELINNITLGSTCGNENNNVTQHESMTDLSGLIVENSEEKESEAAVGTDNQNNCYLNDNISITTIDSIINLPVNSWNFITIFGNFNNTISLFNYIDNVNTGPIIGYSRIININEHINNYNIYKI
jgi:hypothetical protein